MNVQHTCLSADIIANYVHGAGDENAAASVERHLNACSACLQAILAHAERDRFYQQVTPIAGGSATDVSIERLALLKNQLKALRASASGAVDTGSSFKLGVGQNTTSLSFLSPSLRPDELGRLGAYRILEVIGMGGMGIVFKAEDIRLERTVALKVMRPEIAARADARERFLREARAAAKIEHDHILAIHQVDEANGVPFITMPFLKGSSLEAFLRDKEKMRLGPVLKLAQILKVGREIARGLAAAHERGLIHRDIKPANLWLDASAGGRVKILDFGLARTTADQQSLTHTGAILGTPGYLAPEQVSAGKVDGRCDLFSLGVVLYRLCTGVLPFEGPDVMSLLMALGTKEPTPPKQLNPDLPQGLNDLVIKLLEKDPAKRIASADDVVKLIQALERPVGDTASVVRQGKGDAATVAVNTRNDSASVVNGRHRRRTRVGLAAACVATLITAIIVIIQTKGGDPEAEDNNPPAPLERFSENFANRKGLLPDGWKGDDYRVGVDPEKRACLEVSTTSTGQPFMDLPRVKLSRDFSIEGECFLAGWPAGFGYRESDHKMTIHLEGTDKKPLHIVISWNGTVTVGDKSFLPPSGFYSRSDRLQVARNTHFRVARTGNKLEVSLDDNPAGEKRLEEIVAYDKLSVGLTAGKGYKENPSRLYRLGLKSD